MSEGSATIRFLNLAAREDVCSARVMLVSPGPNQWEAVRRRVMHSSPSTKEDQEEH